MSFKLTILGSSAALPTISRFSTAHVLNFHERFFLIDCGEGTQIQLRRNKIRFSRLNHIFISHLHGDHYYGIFGLISTFSLLGRKQDLHIYAHENLETKINTVFEKGEIVFKIIFHKLSYKEPEIIYSDKTLRVRSFPLKHRVLTCGFRFEEKQKPRNINKKKIQKYNLTLKEILSIKEGNDYISSEGETISHEEMTLALPKARSYAFCSDTRFLESVIEEVKNVDLLYHEATFLQEDKALAVKTLHTTSIEAATVAKKANAGKLLIGHFSSRYANKQDFLTEAKTIFENTYIANDNDTHVVESKV